MEKRLAFLRISHTPTTVIEQIKHATLDSVEPTTWLSGKQTQTLSRISISVSGDDSDSVKPVCCLAHWRQDGVWKKKKKKTHEATEYLSLHNVNKVTKSDLQNTLSKNTQRRRRRRRDFLLWYLKYRTCRNWNLQNKCLKTNGDNIVQCCCCSRYMLTSAFSFFSLATSDQTFWTADGCFRVLLVSSSSGRTALLDISWFQR